MAFSLLLKSNVLRYNLKIIQRIHFKFDGFWQTNVAMEPLSCSRKKNISNSRRSSVPLCSQSPYRRSLMQVISDIFRACLCGSIFQFSKLHKWNPRVCTFSSLSMMRWELPILLPCIRYLYHFSEEYYSFEWICHNPIYLFTSWWTFEMFSIWGLLRTKLQASPFCGLIFTF